MLVGVGVTVGVLVGVGEGVMVGVGVTVGVLVGVGVGVTVGVGVGVAVGSGVTGAPPDPTFALITGRYFFLKTSVTFVTLSMPALCLRLKFSKLG